MDVVHIFAYYCNVMNNRHTNLATRHRHNFTGLTFWHRTKLETQFPWYFFPAGTGEAQQFSPLAPQFGLQVETVGTLRHSLVGASEGHSRQVQLCVCVCVCVHASKMRRDSKKRYT